MKNKGFTLVELLAAIMILVVLMGLVTTNAIKVLENGKKTASNLEDILNDDGTFKINILPYQYSGDFVFALIDVDDGEYPITTIQYQWTRTTVQPVNNWLATSSGEIVTNRNGGTSYLHVKATDSSGAIIYSSEGPFKVNDTTPPVITGTVDISLPVQDAINRDPLTGIVVTDDSGETITATYDSFTVPLAGVYYIIYHAVDSSGNQAVSVSSKITVIDTTNPIIVFGTNGDTSSYTRTKSSAVTASDSDSGINTSTLEYQWTTSTTQPTEASFTMSFTNGGVVSSPAGLTGTYYLWVIAKDQSNNTTIARTNAFTLDCTLPTLAFGTNGNATYGTSRSTTVTVSDAHSGVNTASFEYQWTTSTTQPTEASFTTAFTNGATITSPAGVTGGYYLWILAKDTATNTIISRSNVFNLDNTLATVAFGTNGNATYGTSRSSTVTVSDAHSGVNTATLEYQWTTSATQPTEASFVTTFTNGGTITSPAGVTGGYYLWILAKDNSNNTTITGSNVFNLDNTLATVAFGTNGNATYGTSRSTTVTISDAHSGVNTATLEYQWTTSTTPPTEASFVTTFTNGGTITTPAGVTGGYYLWILAKDNATNTTIIGSNVFNLDNTIPTLAFGTNGNATYGTSRSTTITVSDAHIGVNTATLEYQWTTSTTAPTEASFVTEFTNGATLTTPAGVSGGYYLWILGKDTLNNMVINRSNVFNLDNTIPVVSSIVSGTSNVLNTTLTLTMSGSATDAHSGLAANPYVYQTSLNNSTWTTQCTNNTTSCAVSGLTAGTLYYYRICALDLLGNTACVASKTVTTSAVVDVTAPSVAFGTNGNATYAQTRSSTVTVTDGGTGVLASSLKYQWTTSTTQPTEVSFTTAFTNGAAVSSPAGVTGAYYLWILAKDNSSNTTITRTNVFNLDNTLPVITGLTQTITNLNAVSCTFTLTRGGSAATDAHSGFATYTFETSPATSSCSGASLTVCNHTNVYLDTGMATVCAVDNAGNKKCYSGSPATMNVPLMGCGSAG